MMSSIWGDKDKMRQGHLLRQRGGDGWWVQGCGEDLDLRRCWRVKGCWEMRVLGRMTLKVMTVDHGRKRQWTQEEGWETQMRRKAGGQAVQRCVRRSLISDHLPQDLRNRAHIWQHWHLCIWDIFLNCDPVGPLSPNVNCSETHLLFPLRCPP